MNKDDDDNKKFIKDSFIFFIGCFLVSILNFIYHLILGRLLGPIEYGILSSIFAIIYLSTFMTSTFNRVITKSTSEFYSKNQLGLINFLLKKSLKKILIYGMIVFLIFILFSPQISRFMNLDNNTGLILGGIDAFISLVLALTLGALNGMQKFVWQNVSNVLSTVLKLLLAIFFVYLGYSVNGAILALIFSSIAGIIICYIPLKEIFNKKITQTFNPKKLYLYSIPVFFSSLIPILLITLDQVLVKHYFSSYYAGLYAAASNLGKIIWFGSGFFVGAFFPKIIYLKNKNKDTSKLLIKTLVISSFLAFIGCVIYFIAPYFIVNLLYGDKYLEVAPLLGIISISMLLYSLTQIFIAYNLAIEKYNFIYLLLIGLLIEIIGIFFFHNSLLDIVKIFTISNAITLGSIIIFNLNDFFKNGD